MQVGGGSQHKLPSTKSIALVGSLHVTFMPYCVHTRALTVLAHGIRVKAVSPFLYTHVRPHLDQPEAPMG